MRGWVADLNYALRIYRRTKLASLIAVTVLAVALACVSAFLSLYVDLAFQEHPGLERGGRVVTIAQQEGGLFGLPYGLVERMNEELTSLDGVVGIASWAQQREGEEPLSIDLVSRDFFPLLRPRLLTGRGFEPAQHEQDGEPVAVISYRYWQDRLGGADVLGTIIELEPRPIIVAANPDPTDALDFRIIGIMAPEMTGLVQTNVSVWLPLERALPLIATGPNRSTLIRQLSLWTFGRRAAGASARAVTSEIAARFPDAIEEFRMPAGGAIQAVDGIVRSAAVQRESKRQLQLFLGASLLLALVAAANVSLFLLARAPGRRRELGIRVAVGAPMRRLARQLASEAGLLVVVAAVGGLAMSIWLSQFLRGLAFLRQAEWQNATLLDWRVLTLIGIFLIVLTGLVSLAPILGLRRLGIAASSRQVVARATLAQRLAGSVQLAIAGALGAAAIAFGWYLGALMLSKPGYETRDRYAVELGVTLTRDIMANPVRMMESMAIERIRMRETIEAIPGVTAMAFGQPVPGVPTPPLTTTAPDPRDPAATIRVRTGTIDSRVIEVLGLRLAHGRSPTDDDVDVVLVNRRLALELFGRDNVVGEHFSTGPFTQQTQEIIGVLEDLSFEHPAAEVEPMLFSLATRTPAYSSAVVESSLPAAALQQELKRIAGEGEIELEIMSVRPLSQLRRNLLAADRARGFLTIGTAILVVLLAAFGFHGTQRYLVTAGRREYAIRSAIGAEPKALGRLVLTRGLTLGLPGLVLGAMLAFITVSWLRDDFVSRDVSAYAVTAVVAAGLVLLLAVASFGPARQAMRTQPAPLLREE